MMKKLMKRMQVIRIGHSILFMLLFLAMSGCWVFEMDKSGTRYSVRVRNFTNDSLLLVFGEGRISDSLYLFPDSIGVIKGRKVFEGEDIIRDVLFTGGDKAFEEQVRVIQNDSLLVTWEGPGREMPDTVHHFYNYNSWESWLVDTYAIDGIVQFTIYDSDFESQ